MKKLILVAAIFLVTGVMFGQNLQKGMVLAVSSYELTLKDSVTFQQFVDFMQKKYVPEFEKSMPGVKLSLLFGDRGENKFKYGELLVFDDVKTRDKYFPTESDTVDSPAMKVVNEKLKAVTDESGKYVLNTRRIYTDWIVK